ncbi:uncharacterized protein LOC144132740 isoform X2 [Amblyomma americanum]
MVTTLTRGHTTTHWNGGEGTTSSSASPVYATPCHLYKARRYQHGVIPRRWGSEQHRPRQVQQLPGGEAATRLRQMRLHRHRGDGATGLRVGHLFQADQDVVPEQACHDPSEGHQGGRQKLRAPAAAPVGLPQGAPGENLTEGGQEVQRPGRTTGCLRRPNHRRRRRPRPSSLSVHGRRSRTGSAASAGSSGPPRSLRGRLPASLPAADVATGEAVSLGVDTFAGAERQRGRFAVLFVARNAAAQAGGGHPDPTVRQLRLPLAGPARCAADCEHHVQPLCAVRLAGRPQRWSRTASPALADAVRRCRHWSMAGAAAVAADAGPPTTTGRRGPTAPRGGTRPPRRVPSLAQPTLAAGLPL